jgi:hypothetical protein
LQRQAPFLVTSIFTVTDHRRIPTHDTLIQVAFCYLSLSEINPSSLRRSSPLYRANLSYGRYRPYRDGMHCVLCDCFTGWTLQDAREHVLEHKHQRFIYVWMFTAAGAIVLCLN